jgi:hypothetical protein
VGPLMLGVVSVGLVVGLMVGRSTERARRGFKDLATAKATLSKGRQVAYGELRKAAGGVLLIAFIFVALFIGLIKSQG